MTSLKIKKLKTCYIHETCVDAIATSAFMWGFVYSIGTAIAVFLMATVGTEITFALADVYTESLVIFTMGGALRGLIMWHVRGSEQAQLSIIIPYLQLGFVKYQPREDSKVVQRLTVGDTRVQKPAADDSSIDFAA